MPFAPTLSNDARKTLPSALLILATLAAPTAAAGSPPGREPCPEGSASYFVTGYLRWSPPMNPLTADGTPIWTPEPIVAASYELELGERVWLPGLGVFRVADRFGSAHHWRRIDVAVWTRAEAFALTGDYCLWRLGPAPDL